MGQRGRRRCRHAVRRQARAGVPRPGEPAEALRVAGPAEAAGGGRLLAACAGRRAAAVPAQAGGPGDGGGAAVRNRAATGGALGAAGAAPDTGVRSRGLEPAAVRATAGAPDRLRDVAQGPAAGALAGRGVPGGGDPATDAVRGGERAGLHRRAGDDAAAIEADRARDSLLDRRAPAAGGPQRAAAQGAGTSGQAAGGPAPAGDRHDPPHQAGRAGRGLLRSRWSQEASFKWMRQEYALDTLAEHATEEVAGGTRVVNPGSREIGKGLDRLKARSGRLRRRQAQLGRKTAP